ncbi:MAG: hypothetical protein GQF41_2498 [Candidatus Rifleibacterium amylolyticum]|nr:MAG: hypothetical protein GQF41_2498 [Candidatus Rifleibacterium amylolyticum]NLF97712.1 hypothetical protein [Candidatus Riflebacteria bacterium]
MKREPYDSWEEKFIALCEEQLEEEPFYPYEHLWRKNLNVKQAFAAYLEENPDYAEKFQELNESTPSAAESAEFLALAKKLEEQKKKKELESRIEEKMSKFCPECARVMNPKGICKCGYRRPSKKSGRSRDY